MKVIRCDDPNYQVMEKVADIKLQHEFEIAEWQYLYKTEYKTRTEYTQGGSSYQNTVQVEQLSGKIATKALCKHCGLVKTLYLYGEKAFS